LTSPGSFRRFRSAGDNPALAERFEIFAGGFEIANGYSELNDPEDRNEDFRNR